MKAAFNIPPVSAEMSSLHLLVEAGDYGISLIWFTKAPFSVKGLAVYNSVNAHENDIKEIFRSQGVFLAGLASATICYDFKESVLVPGKYNHSSVSEGILSLVYGDDTDTILNNDLITSSQIYNHYRVTKNIEYTFAKQFPRAHIFHSTSLQVEKFNHEKELFYCIIFHNSLKVILYKEQKLQVVQQFSYINPEDVTYYLLNVCEQHAVKPAEVQLRLSGMIDEHSKLYTELYQYFSNIVFEEVAEGIYTPDELKELPSHFFSHLTALALCVS